MKIEERILNDFRSIMAKEIKIRPEHWCKYHLWYFDLCGDVTKCEREIYKVVWRIFEAIHSGFVSRSYNLTYNLYDGEMVYESVGAHTNVVSAIATEALDFHYGGEFGVLGRKSCVKTIDGYSYRDIMEAIRLHDLPENEIGDLPDNGSRDESEKHFQEARYLKSFFDTYSDLSKTIKRNVLGLISSMDMHDSPTGRLIYLSDKVAALLVTLFLDFIGKSPMMLEDSPHASERDRQEMALCDSGDYAYKASEMWALDFFRGRQLVRFDDDFFFTAIVVMSTLMVNGKWYIWREEMYENDKK